MRIDELVARLLPGIEARVIRPNSEVLGAILVHGWTQKAAVKPRREADRPVQYEMRV